MIKVYGFFVFLFFAFSSFPLLGQGIRGQVLSEDNEPLPFASVYFRNLGDGVPTNEEGIFEYALAPGIYDVIFQFLTHLLGFLFMRPQLNRVSVSVAKHLVCWRFKRTLLKVIKVRHGF